jgi:nicotinamide phosphoribosyltransferase
MKTFNILLATDVYKLGHMEQYKPGVNKVYSYLTARSGKNFDKTVFFGLQYYLERYLTQPITPEMGKELLEYRKRILGSNSPDVESKVRQLCQLGYLPLEIKAVPEGTVMPTGNVLLTITNTLPEFYWVVGFVESILLKLWYSITVASCVYKYRTVVDDAFERTVDESLHFLKDFTVHDFGYRGDGSEEGAAISGAAHIISFMGSDTVPAFPFVVEYYGANIDDPVMLSVPASEHSVMCSFGKDDEIAAFEHMMDLYPSGIVSIVSDTFNVYRVLTEFAERLKPRILARDGKVVFRPDSGNPEYIICGNPQSEVDSLEWKGAIRLLDEMFGHTVNEKGYKVLNSKVGLIYGDGMYLDRYIRTLNRLEEMGYAACNLVIGVGGILRNHSRDTMGFAIKATYVEVNGEPQEIEKDPVTDPGKKSRKGLLRLDRNDAGEWYTTDCVSPEQESGGELIPVFRDGQILRRYTLNEIRKQTLK